MRPPIKNPTLLLITIVAVSFTACHKDQTQLAGKWQEVTVRSYSVNKSTGKTTDTTVANFGGLDYAIFSGDTCIISNTLPPSGQLIQKYTYSRTARGYALRPFYINSGSVDLLPTMDTVINITANSLVVHYVASAANLPTTYTIDAWYSR